MGMTKENAIKYLARKGILKSKKYLEKTLSPEEKRTRQDEEEIRRVMKEGKIYGDPVVQLH